jgi:O-Antigen ligase
MPERAPVDRCGIRLPSDERGEGTNADDGVIGRGVCRLLRLPVERRLRPGPTVASPTQALPLAPAPSSRWSRELAARAALVSAPAWLLAFGLIFLLGVDSGGYSATSWGWATLILCSIGALALVLGAEARFGAVEVVFLVALLAFFAWGLASGIWSPSLTEPLLQSQRTLVYVAAALVALLLARRSSYDALLTGVWAAITLISTYSVLTRLVPDRLGFVDALAGYRLEQPLGYWNGLGIFAAIGALLALGLAAHSRNATVRALAAASTVPLVSALYFTFSRGAWIALGAGLLVALVLDPRRLRLISALVVVGPWPALGVWRASGSEPLTHIGTGLAAAAHSGHRFLVLELVLAFAAGVAGLALLFLERRWSPPLALRRLYAGAIVLVIAVGLAAGVVHFGSPPTIARHLYDSFVGQSAATSNANLNRRLFTLSGGQRIPQWKVAWREYEAHRWLGSGLGTYERWWKQLRPAGWKVVNVHNLYLETLAEVGPVGLGLLLVALAVPLAAAFQARRRELAAAATAAYVAFLAHAAVDWDWQLPAVTLAALFCGTALVVAARRSALSPMHPRVRLLLLAAVLVAATLAFVGLRGNQAVAASQHAAQKGDYSAAAADARRASHWLPWSARPWQLRGEAELARRQLAVARADLREAAAKNPADASIWLDLALASSGAERAHALAEAARLNPLDPIIASFGRR